MTQSQVKQAAAELAQGNYAAALEIYQRLAQQLGQSCFAANIRVCQRRLNGQAAHQVATAAQPAQIKPKPGNLHQPGPIELCGSEPLWFEIPVTPGQQLLIEAATEYQGPATSKDRKAVLLLNSFDGQGKQLDQPCGKMARSGHLKALFKYLPCTRSQVQELHNFTVPAGVREIRVGLCGFNQTPDERVTLRELRVHPKPDHSKAPKFVPPSPQVAEISILGWPEHPPNGKPYVIGIMDEFTTGCFEQDLNLVQPRPDNWYALAEKYQPELFLIESAWKGNYGSWQYRVGDYANKPGQEVAQICEYARQKGIPTIFWNKEDPVHHDKFMCSARLVDHIFTTDANMRASYEAKTGNQRVHVLPFAAQPGLHKPAPLAGRKPRACFAGAWYGNRHAERSEAMQWLLQAANRHGLDIYDRNHGTGIFPFPEEYQAGIKGSLPYKALCEEYRSYRIFLNVNSVTDSPTMFARRVFELMACGTPVVSTYARGIEELFESDAVWMVKSESEANEALHTLMTDDQEWRRRSLAGIREVFSNHTYAHRLNQVFQALGLATQLPTEPEIFLLATANSSTDLQTLDRFARSQTYKRFRIGVECAPTLMRQTSALSQRIVLLQTGQLNQWLREQRAAQALAGWLATDAFYGEHYLRDLANASLYAPEANGWAKSLGTDQFACGGAAVYSGAIWKQDNFREQGLRALPNAALQQPDLYITDADQFQTAGIEHKLRAAGAR